LLEQKPTACLRKFAVFALVVNRYRLMCHELVRWFRCFSNSLFKRFAVRNLNL